jgi:biopolymer transport protein ExbB
MQAAEKDLASVRSEIEAERRPSVKRLEELESEMADLRSKVEAARRQRDESGASREAFERQVSMLRDECRFIREVLVEYRRSAPAQAGPEGAVSIETALAPADSLLADQARSSALAEAVAVVLRAAQQETVAGIGGRTVKGEALDSRGVAQEGVFAVLGPAVYFRGGNLLGPVTLESGNLLPTVWQGFSREQCEEVSALADGRETPVPVDASGTGDGLRAARARLSFKEHMISGGPVMVPLVAVGLIALVTILWKFFQLARIPAGRAPDLGPVLGRAAAGDMDGARTAANELWTPLNRVVLAALEYRDASREHIEEILNERILSELPALERHLGSLAVLGGVSPLLGLLGTVTGMIHTFQLVTLFGTGDARLLSGGLSEALVTTEVGLVIAIPVLISHAYLARRVGSIVASIERSALELVNDMKKETPR